MEVKQGPFEKVSRWLETNLPVQNPDNSGISDSNSNIIG